MAVSKAPLCILLPQPGLHWAHQKYQHLHPSTMEVIDDLTVLIILDIFLGSFAQAREENSPRWV